MTTSNSDIDGLFMYREHVISQLINKYIQTLYLVLHDKHNNLRDNEFGNSLDNYYPTGLIIK